MNLLEYVRAKKVSHVVLAGGLPTKRQFKTLTNPYYKVIGFAQR